VRWSIRRSPIRRLATTVLLVSLFTGNSHAESTEDRTNKEQERFACAWIHHQKLPPGLISPAICDGWRSSQHILDDMRQFWSDWALIDPSNSAYAQSVYEADWTRHWGEVRDLVLASNLPSVLRRIDDSAITSVSNEQAVRAEAVKVCRGVMTRAAYSNEALSTDQRHAAIDLCQTDPQAHLKPFPWQQSTEEMPLPSPIRPDAARYTIALKPDGGIFVAPVLVNDRITLDFAIDSGAADVTIPLDVFSTLIRTGTIKKEDVLGSTTGEMADGSTISSKIVRIKTLRIGDLELHDIQASVVPPAGSLLLGQSFLSRLSSWSIDNAHHVLMLNGPVTAHR
jgi:clan AA aspartic protease (TIGR02281 family)